MYERCNMRGKISSKNTANETIHYETNDTKWNTIVRVAAIDLSVNEFGRNLLVHNRYAHFWSQKD